MNESTSEGNNVVTVVGDGGERERDLVDERSRRRRRRKLLSIGAANVTTAFTDTDTANGKDRHRDHR